jgi:hypothetical protein
VADADVVAQQIARLAADGYLEPADVGPTGVSLGLLDAGAPGRYRLTGLGVAEGGRSFQDEFADLTRPSHYECSPGCWCQDPNHADEPCPTHPEQPSRA